MFLNGMKESTQEVIEIQDWSYSSYLYMIEYLYTGQIESFNPGVAQEVLGLADAYAIENLKSLCENTLIHSVDTNVIDLLIDAHRFDAQELKKNCMNYIIKNFSDIQNTKEFESLEQVPSLLMELMKSIANTNSIQ